MNQSNGCMGGLTAPHVVSTIEELQEIVATITEVGAFAFDVETRGIVERHSDVMAWIDQEWETHATTIKTTSEDVIARSKEILVIKWGFSHY